VAPLPVFKPAFGLIVSCKGMVVSNGKRPQADIDGLLHEFWGREFAI
jgi:hypothetical protein